MQELEKFKYVLDYKVKDLLHNIEPTEQEARQCKERMQKMEVELFRFVPLEWQWARATFSENLRATFLF